MPAHPPRDAGPVLAALVHKLGSPLGAVANYAYLLEGGVVPDALEGIQGGVGRVKTLLEGARRWLDGVDPKPGSLTADEAVAALERAADAQRRSLSLDIRALPALAVGVDTWVLLGSELLANAAQAGDRAAVVVDGAVRDGVARVSFRDDGPGWSGADAERAFGYFVTLDPESPRAGMGLSIVADLAKACGGQAWGAPRTNGGAVVHIELPAGN